MPIRREQEPPTEGPLLILLFVVVSLGLFIRSPVSPIPFINGAFRWLNEHAVAVAASIAGTLAALAWLTSLVGFSRVFKGVKTFSLIVFGACLLAMTGALLGIVFRSAIFGP